MLAPRAFDLSRLQAAFERPIFFFGPRALESTASQIENGQRDQANPLPTLAAKRDQAWEKEGRAVQWGEAGGPQVGLCGRQ
jgi:hypothetical protein